MENVTNLELEMLAEAAEKRMKNMNTSIITIMTARSAAADIITMKTNMNTTIMTTMTRNTNIIITTMTGECGCGHDHDHEEHEHHHHDHDGECGCGHDHHHEGHHHADDVFSSWGTETPNKYDKETLEDILKKLANTEEYGKILRSKGMLPCTDGTWMYFDLVPGEYEIRDGKADLQEESVSSVPN